MIKLRNVGFKFLNDEFLKEGEEVKKFGTSWKMKHV